MAPRRWNKLNPGLAMSISERSKFQSTSIKIQSQRGNIGLLTYLLKVGQFEDAEGGMGAAESLGLHSGGATERVYGKIDKALYDSQVPHIPALPRGAAKEVRDDPEKLAGLIERLKKANDSVESIPMDDAGDIPFGIRSPEMAAHIAAELKAIEEANIYNEEVFQSPTIQREDDFSIGSDDFNEDELRENLLPAAQAFYGADAYLRWYSDGASSRWVI